MQKKFNKPSNITPINTFDDLDVLDYTDDTTVSSEQKILNSNSSHSPKIKTILKSVTTKKSSQNLVSNSPIPTLYPHNSPRSNTPLTKNNSSPFSVSESPMQIMSPRTSHNLEKPLTKKNSSPFFVSEYPMQIMSPRTSHNPLHTTSISDIQQPLKIIPTINPKLNPKINPKINIVPKLNLNTCLKTDKPMLTQNAPRELHLDFLFEEQIEYTQPNTSSEGLPPIKNNNLQKDTSRWFPKCNSGNKEDYIVKYMQGTDELIDDVYGWIPARGNWPVAKILELCNLSPEMLKSPTYGYLIFIESCIYADFSVIQFIKEEYERCLLTIPTRVYDIVTDCVKYSDDIERIEFLIKTFPKLVELKNFWLTY